MHPPTSAKRRLMRRANPPLPPLCHSYGGYVMSMVVAFNVYGVLQTALMSYPFIYNEAALDGLAPYFLTDPKRDIALPAIWIPTLISLVMAVVGDFTVLTQV